MNINPTSLSTILLSLLLAGCSLSESFKKHPVKEIGGSIAPAPLQAVSPDSHNLPTDISEPPQPIIKGTGQCQKQLEALNKYETDAYDSFSEALIREGIKIKKHDEARDSFDEELNAIALAQYETAVRKICYRIHTELGRIILSQD